MLDFDMLETVTTALLAGSNIMFYGPSGSGKTTLAKDIWNLYPKKVFVVDGCPVHDNPFSVFDSEFSKITPPCPFCKSRFGSLGMDDLGDFQPSLVSPDKIPVRLTTLKEGTGFSRVQGSAEVFPDNLTGTLNLRKLEEIGDPTSPLVLEPGKLLQANRGVFIADEIGKLPIGTQNVLLQALQENIVSPAKSRETFPAAFLTITTSNLDDLDNITPPLNGRLVSIHIGYNKDHKNNRKIVELALKRRSVNTFIPAFLIDSDVHIIEEWRRVFGDADGSEVGSNRTMIDTMMRSEARALLRNNSTVAIGEFRDGVREALTGRIWVGGQNPQSKERLDGFLLKNVDKSLGKGATAYWCRFFKGTLNSDKSEGKRIADELNALLKDQNKSSDYFAGKAEYKKADRWTAFVAKEEKYPGGMGERERAVTVFAMLSATGIFEGEPAC
jgi:MoxR-like ATPase